MITKCQRRGSISLIFAAIMLPLMFVLFTVSIDLTKYNRESRLAQQALDDAALYAYRFLPYQAKAFQAAQSYLSRFGEFAAATQIVTSADSISLSLTSQSELTFARLFVPEASLTLTAYSRARGTPFDTIILMDASSYLSPGDPFGAVWGDATAWPASSFFQLEREFRLSPDGETSVLVDPRFTTEQCFNPLFSAIKRATIRTYEYLAGFQFNALGVGVFPGSSASFVDEVRPVQFGTTPIPNWGEAQFTTYTKLLGGTELCAAAAERELYHDDYRFPTSNSSIEGLWKPDQGAPSMVLAPLWEFNPEYQSYLRLDEAVWSQVTHEGFPETGEVLTDALSRLVPVSLVERGGLQNRSRKSVIIIAADVPYVGGQRFSNGSDAVAQALSSRLELYRQAIRDDPELTLKVYYVALEYREDATQLIDLSARLDAFAEFFNAQELIDGVAHENFNLMLLRAATPEALVREVVGQMVLDKKLSVLSK